MRVTQQTSIDQALQRLRQRQTAAADAQRTVATGRTLVRASDDPAAASRSLAIRADLRATEQAGRSIDDARSNLTAADSALTAVSDRMHRVRELVVAGASATSPDARAAMAAEVDAIRDEILALANDEHGGRALFGGFSAGPAVTSGPGGIAYAGDAGGVVRRFDDQETLRVDVTADEVFGFADGDDLFTRLSGISDRLRSNDTAGLSQDLTGLDAARGRLGEAMATVGAAAARVESAASRNQAALVELRGELSLVEDADMAEAVMELQLQEVAYQATLGALARTLPPSLVDFLR